MNRELVSIPYTVKELEGREYLTEEQELFMESVDKLNRKKAIRLGINEDIIEKYKKKRALTLGEEAV